jgi:ribosomal protein L4
MPSIPLYDRAGKTIGDVELSDELFAAPVNTAVLHQVVTAQLAAPSPRRTTAVVVWSSGRIRARTSSACRAR